MRFPGRELTQSSQPVELDELTPGAVYFSVSFVDEDMLFPTLEPWVFLGTDLEREGSGQVYFQDLDSHRSGLRFDEPGVEGGQAVFYTGSAAELGHILTFEAALEVLMRCSLRRRKRGA